MAEDDDFHSAPLQHEPWLPEELRFLHVATKWWAEKPERLDASRRLIRIEPDLTSMVEGRRFRSRIVRMGRIFCAWLAGFVGLAAALADLSSHLRGH